MYDLAALRDSAAALGLVQLLHKTAAFDVPGKSIQRASARREDEDGPALPQLQDRTASTTRKHHLIIKYMEAVYHSL